MKKFFDLISSFFQKESSKDITPDSIVNGYKQFKLGQQKEVTDVENFVYLLKQFNNIQIDYLVLNQNINSTIRCFAADIWQTQSILSYISSTLHLYTDEKVKKIISLGIRKQKSFLFFCENHDKKDYIFTANDLKIIIGYAYTILEYFEQNKTSEDRNTANICNAIFGCLDVMYIFFFDLLFYLKNIDTSDFISVVGYNEF